MFGSETIETMTFYSNESMLRELRQDPSIERLSNLGYQKGAFPIPLELAGSVVPLGHTYSIVLEAIARNGKAYSTAPGQFIDHIKAYVEEHPNPLSMGSASIGNIDLSTPTYHSDISNAVVDYMWKSGVDAVTVSDTMFQVLGVRINGFNPERIPNRFSR